MGYQLLSNSSNFDRVGMLVPILRARLSLTFRVVVMTSRVRRARDVRQRSILMEQGGATLGLLGHHEHSRNCSAYLQEVPQV